MPVYLSGIPQCLSVAILVRRGIFYYSVEDYYDQTIRS